MHDFAPTLKWRQAALHLEARLRELTGQVPQRLDRYDISSCYPKRDLAAAWRVNVAFSDGVTRRLDIVAAPAFPRVPVRTALVDHPKALTWPHVEGDGILCLLPNMSEVDPEDPTAVTENLLIRSVGLIEQLLKGDIVNRDFHEEFLTYWAYKTHSDGSHLFSLVRLSPPSRFIYVWKGKGITVVGDSVDGLHTWAARRYGEAVSGKIEKGAFLWMEEPPLPVQYPETAADLFSLGQGLGSEAARSFADAASEAPDEVVAVIGAKGRGGSGLIAVRVPNPKLVYRSPSPVRDPVSKGFRPTKAPVFDHKERPFDTADFAESPREMALLRRCGQFLEDDRWHHGPRHDRRRKVEQIVPMIKDQIGIDRRPDVVRQRRICIALVEHVELAVFEITQSR